MRKDIFTTIVLVISTLFLLERCNINAKTTTDEEEPVHEIENKPVIYEYGLPVDSFYITEGKIKRGQNLAQILNSHGVPNETLNQLSKKNNAFDLRKIRSGSKYKLFYPNDTIKIPSFFAYEHSLTEYVLFKLTDSVEILLGIKPTSIIEKTASGTITSSLWNAMKDNNINPLLAIELSELYAWSIDFFGLQNGDNFHVIYSESFLNDSISIGIEQIHAAVFSHIDKEYYAFSFVQNDKPSFFNEEGGSLKRAFLKAPLKYNRVSSKFSRGRLHPILKIVRPHSGVDYAAPEGTPVYSIGDGVIIKKGYQQKGAGNYIKIKHNSIYTTQYAHLKSFAKGISNGKHVTQGDLIGYVGKTGYATGPHLDFRVFKNGSPTDPLKIEAPSVEPVKTENLEEFNIIKTLYINKLDSVKAVFYKQQQQTVDSTIMAIK